MGTTDFDLWLEQASPDSTEMIYSLHDAVFSESINGVWEVSKQGSKTIVKVGHVNDALIIASDKAKRVFLKHFKKHYMNGDDDAECWYGFQRNMDNPKA